MMERTIVLWQALDISGRRQSLSGKASMVVFGRVIGAMLIIAGGSLPASAEGPAPPAIHGTGALSGEGVPCAGDDVCRSHHCNANWDNSRYCTRADLSCAFPGSSGVAVGFTTTNYGVTYVCQSDGGWQPPKPAMSMPVVVLSGRDAARGSRILDTQLVPR